MGVHLVTGTSSGLGRATALALAEAGHHVLAGARHVEDAPQHSRIEPVLLDTTDATHVDALGDRLRADHLDGLVNNAGVVVDGAFEAVALEHWRRQLEVNVLGVVAVTQAALPALRRSRGRVVNVGSVASVLAPPFVGPYATSKAAVRAMSASLRRELLPVGVRVTLLEAGAIATPIWEKSLDTFDSRIDDLDSELEGLYARRLRRFKAVTEASARSGVPPEDAAAAILGVLTARRPPALLTLGREAKLRLLAQRLLPTRVFDELIVRSAGGR